MQDLRLLLSFVAYLEAQMYINFDAYIAMTFSHERVICYATFNI